MQGSLNRTHAASEDAWQARQLAIAMPTFPDRMTCGEAFVFFRAHQDQAAAAIVDGDDRVVGIVNRLRFLARYAQPYIPELYAKRAITHLANSHPLVVDEGLAIMDLASALALEWPDALRECFVITRNGRYLGIGTSESLVRTKLSILLAKEAALKRALYDAQGASQAKTAFLALMSHELRTPLNAIIGFSEVLGAEMFGKHSNPRYREYSNDIHDAATHLLSLINDILDLSKSEAGMLELREEPIDLEELFAETLALIAQRARTNGVLLSRTIAADFPLLMADRLRMKQVLLNLLTNAVKFTPRGGKVVISADLVDDRCICLSVADTGIGMEPESIPLALEPFRQIDSPLSRTVEGTGLGLALVRSLAERHGAALRIESELHAGTVVRVTLPRERTHKSDYATKARA